MNRHERDEARRKRKFATLARELNLFFNGTLSTEDCNTMFVLISLDLDTGETDTVANVNADGIAALLQCHLAHCEGRLKSLTNDGTSPAARGDNTANRKKET